MGDEQARLFAATSGRDSYGYRIDGSVVQWWATKTQASEAARAIRWPARSIVRVQTRFQLGYALIGGPGQGLLSREGYAELLGRFNGR